MYNSRNILFAIVLSAAFAAPAGAQTKKFEIDNQKNKYRNVVSIESVADFETFTGKTNEISGSLFFDPTAKKGGGKIVVDPSSIDTGIPLRNEHMKSEGWLDTKKYPEIVFEAEKVQSLKNDEYKVTGKFTLHGVTKKITTNVRVRYHAADASTKANGFVGDVVQISTKFNLNLTDYGIVVPSGAAGKVAKEVTISISSYAVSK